MSIVLGVDLGSSSIKIVIYKDAGLCGTQQLLYGKEIQTVEDALQYVMEDYILTPAGIEYIVVTGVGSIDLGDTILGIPLVKVDEFEAIARGGLTLSEEKEAIVVSMGTGTAFVKADENGFRYLGGTSVGGGTLTGICRYFFNLSSSAEIKERAKKGDLSRVDLQIRDLVSDESYPLSPDVTSSNLGKISGEATADDMVLGFINMICQNIGKMSMLYCSNDSIKTVVLIGSLTEMPQTAECFANMQRLSKLQFVIPPNAQFATAIGAVLAARKKAEE